MTVNRFLSSRRTVLVAVGAGVTIIVGSVVFCAQISETPLSTRCRFGVPPPSLQSPADIRRAVMSSEPQPLTLIARVFGVVTTPFKANGIRGWIATSSCGVVQASSNATTFLATSCERST
jgi:hypothetical protein